MGIAWESMMQVLNPGLDASSLGDWVKNKTVVVRINHPCTILGVGALLTVVMDTDAATLTVTRRVTPGSDTNAVAVATVTLPTLTAAGKIVAKKLATPQDANPGDELKFVMSNNGGSMTWREWIRAVPRAEGMANWTDYIETA